MDGITNSMDMSLSKLRELVMELYRQETTACSQGKTLVLLGTHLLPTRRGCPPLLSLPMGTLEERGS